MHILCMALLQVHDVVSGKAASRSSSPLNYLGSLACPGLVDSQDSNDEHFVRSHRIAMCVAIVSICKGVVSTAGPRDI
jgi:hypothetical protein